MLPWKKAAIAYHRQLLSELAGSKHLRDLLTAEVVRRRIAERNELKLTIEVVELRRLVKANEAVTETKA